MSHCDAQRKTEMLPTIRTLLHLQVLFECAKQQKAVIMVIILKAETETAVCPKPTKTEKAVYFLPWTR